MALAGAVLLAGHAALLFLSPSFTWGTPAAPWPTAALVGLLLLMGCAYLTLLGSCAGLAARWLPLALLAGLVMRVLLVFSTPVLEDDWYRYLWDGASVATSVNPWAHAPAQALPLDALGNPRPDTTPDLQRLRDLGAAQPHWPERVAYPYLTSPYPPLAQGAFWLAHTIAPFSLTAWRCLLLTVDIVTLALLLLLARRLSQPAPRVLLYWWNPLVPLLAINMGHMDLLLLPPLLGALWFCLHGAPLRTAACLGVATLVKLWPLLLLPLLLRRWWRTPAALLGAIACFAIVAAPAAAPLLAAPLADSGLATYALHWDTNGWLFSIIQTVLASTRLDQPELLARVLAGLAIVSVAAWHALRFTPGTAQSGLSTEAGSELVQRATFITLALFVLSPAGYPWYALWFTPLLALQPVAGAAAFAVTLPLYFLRFVIDEPGVFETYIVPLEFGPPLALLLWHSRARRHV